MSKSHLNLSSLDGTNGFRINGIDSGDRSGRSVSSAGDVNGDGVDDVIIGAYLADPDGKYNAGESYIVYGSENWSFSDLELSSLDGTNGFRINGIDPQDYSGDSVSSAGDVNGDGIDDIIIGAYGADPNGQTGAGESYVVFGSSTRTSAELDISSLDGTNGFQIIGINYGDNSGRSVSSAGDVNGDGIDDIIIGAWSADPDGKYNAGESYIVYGSENWSFSDLELSSLDGTNGFRINGIDPQDYSGGSVSSAGDVNGDGIDDIIIGAYGADPNGQTGAGESYVVFGSSTRTSAELDISSLDGTNGFQIIGINSGDFSGGSVSSAGDVNGDGIDDIIIGASSADPAGESYVVFGSSTRTSAELDISSLDGTNGFQINGIEQSDFSGFSVSSAGDVNGDGIDDIIIGAYGADPAGESYVVFGSSTRTSAELDISSLDGTNGFQINGIEQSDFSGFSVSSAGDVNEDGIDDIIIGAFRADPSGKTGAGESYVVFGERLNNTPTVTSSAVTSINEDASYSYTFTASDVDVGETVTLSAETKPDWLSLDAGTGVLSGTPTNDEVGDHSVVLRATDGSGAYDEQSFTVSVNNVNDSPTLVADFAAPADISIAQGVEFSDFATITFSGAFEDADTTDVLKFSAEGLPGGVSIEEDTGVISGKPSSTAFGEYTVTVSATDAEGEKVSAPSFTITVTNTNDAPAVVSEDSASIAATEDVALSYDASAFFSDPDIANGHDETDVLTYTLESPVEWLSIDAPTGAVSGTPDNNDVTNEAFTIKVTATDKYDLSVEKEISVTVENTNYAPIATEVNLGILSERATRTITIEDFVNSVTDIDIGDSMILKSLTIQNGSGSIKDNGDNTFTYTPAGASEDTTVTFAYTVSDSNGETSSSTADLHIFDVLPSEISLELNNKLEVVNEQRNLFVPSSSSVTYTVSYEDWVFEESYLSGLFSISVNAIDRLDPDGFPLQEFNFVSDDALMGGGFEIDFGGFPDEASGANVLKLFEGYDFDQKSFEIYNSSGSFSPLIPSPSFGSDVSFWEGDIALWVLSDAGAFLTAEIALTDIEYINDYSSPIAVNAYLTEYVDYFELSGDVFQGDTLTISEEAISNFWFGGTVEYNWFRNGAKIEGANSEAYEATQADVGQEISVNVVIKDEFLGSTTIGSEGSITILNVNDAPVVTSSAVTSINEDASYSYTFIASDVDVGDTVTLSAETQPDWLSFDASTGVLSGTPTNDAVGDHSVVLRATDGSGAYSEQSFTVSVSNVNDAPVVTSSAVTSINEDASYSYTFIASDVDVGDTVTLSAETQPDWLSFDASTGVLSGTPTNDAVGDHSVVLRATDGSGAYSEQSFTVSVSNVNDAPVVTSSAVTSINEDASYSYTFIASDVDVGDTVTLSAETQPDWLSFDASTGVLSGTPTNDAVGDHSVVLRATDGSGAYSEQSFTVSVSNVNDAPVVTSSAVTSINEDASYSYTFIASDVDVGDTVTLSAETQPDWLSFDAETGFLRGKPTNDAVGDHSVVLRATDISGNYDEQSFSITVSNVNDAPVGEVLIASSNIDDDIVLSSKLAFNDADGLPDLSTFSYQWMRDGVSITGALEDDFFLTEDDYDQKIAVLVSYRDNHGTEETVSSGELVVKAPVVEQIAAGVTQTTTTSEENGVSQENKVLRNTAQTSTTVNVLQNSGSSSQVVRAVLPTAVSLSVERPTTTLARNVAVDSLLNSIALRKTTSSEANLEEETQSLTDWSSRLTNLGSSNILDIATFTPVAPTTAPLSSPIVISGGASGAGLNIQQAFVIDTKSLPTGSTIQLDHIEFASIVGSATITGGSGANDVIADSEQQFIVLGEDDDRLDAGGGDDIVGSAGGNDTISGGSGNDVAFGGTGNDSVSGGTGDDKVTDSWGTDELNGDDGNDVIRAFEGGDIINGGAGADTIYGSRGDDVIYGGDDDDVIAGDILVYTSRGADELSGGNGNDSLEGGFGADTFIFNFGETGDNRIERIDTQTADFEVGIDIIELVGFDGTLTADNILGQWQDTDDGAKLTAGNMSIQLTGISASDLSVNDFEFV